MDKKSILEDRYSDVSIEKEEEEHGAREIHCIEASNVNLLGV